MTPHWEVERVLIAFLMNLGLSSPQFKPDVAELFDDFSDMVYRIVFARVRHSSDAEDVFQDVFLRLVKNINKIKSYEHAKAWLIRCAINRCNSHYTSAWQKKTVGFDEYYGECDLSYEQIELLEAVRSLTAEHQEVIHLFYYEGYLGKEIAGILGVNENTVKSRLRRARLELRSVLGEEGNLGTE